MFEMNAPMASAENVFTGAVSFVFLNGTPL